MRNFIINQTTYLIGFLVGAFIMNSNKNLSITILIGLIAFFTMVGGNWVKRKMSKK